jgi:hypothetical protein
MTHEPEFIKEIPNLIAGSVSFASYGRLNIASEVGYGRFFVFQEDTP